MSIEMFDFDHIEVKYSKMFMDASSPAVRPNGDIILYAGENRRFRPNERATIRTGIKLSFTEGFMGRFNNIGSNFMSSGLMVVNVDYTEGEVIFYLYNTDNKHYNLKKGDVLGSLRLLDRYSAKIGEKTKRITILSSAIDSIQTESQISESTLNSFF